MLTICLFCSPVVFNFVPILSVVFFGMTIVSHAADLKVASTFGESSPPLLRRVHVPSAVDRPRQVLKKNKAPKVQSKRDIVPGVGGSLVGKLNRA
jgi:hypothetical protein